MFYVGIKTETEIEIKIEIEIEFCHFDICMLNCEFDCECFCCDFMYSQLDS